jgi:hypothetical protein
VRSRGRFEIDFDPLGFCAPTPHRIFEFPPAVATGEEQLGKFTAGKSKYIRLHLYSGKLILAATYHRRVFVVGRRFAAGAPELTHVCAVGVSGTKPRREAPPPPRLALPRAPRRAATEQPRCSPLPPRRRIP